MAIRHGWAICTRPEYADVVRGAGVIVEEWHGDICGWPEAQAAMRGRYQNVIVTQLFPNYPGQRRESASFALEEWHRAGCEMFFGSWPLKFTQRNQEREAALWASVKALGEGKPLLLLSLIGISGPFKAAPAFEAAIRERWSDRFHIVNLPAIKTHAFYDLLGLYDRATGLITIDTSTLHLCWASTVPSIQLLSCEPEDWHGSVPKGNCVFHCKYREVGDRMREIHSAIEGLAC